MKVSSIAALHDKAPEFRTAEHTGRRGEVRCIAAVLVGVTVNPAQAYYYDSVVESFEQFPLEGSSGKDSRMSKAISSFFNSFTVV